MSFLREHDSSCSAVSCVQDRAAEAAASHTEVVALQEARDTAAAALQQAKITLTSKQDDLKRATEASEAAKKLRDDPPPELTLEAKSSSDTDVAKVLTLDQLLDYTPADTKVHKSYPFFLLFMSSLRHATSVQALRWG